MKKMKKKGPQNTQKTRKKDTKIKKLLCLSCFVAEPLRRVAFCVFVIAWALYSKRRHFEKKRNFSSSNCILFLSLFRSEEPG